MNTPVRSKGFIIARAIRIAQEAGYHPSRLANQKHPRCRIPGMQTELPKSVKSPASDACQVKRGRTVAANSVRAQGEVPIVMNVRVPRAFGAGESRRQQT